MMQLPHRLIWGQLSRHRSKFGPQRCLLHGTTVTQPPTMPTPPPIPPSQGKPVKEIQIPVPWGHISGKWWGRTDVQPVLMLHGWQDNAGTFDTLAPLLHNEALLAVEMVGHGRSSHFPLGQCYTFADSLLTLRLVVRHFGWEKKVSIIGHSMGSIIGYTYAGIFPDGVDKLVSLDCIRGALIPSLPPTGKDLRRVIDTNLSYEAKLTDEGLQPSYPYEEIVDLYWKGCKGSVTRESAEVILLRGLVEMPGGERFRFSRDHRVKVFSWGSMSKASILATASQIACEVLSIRATKSFTSEPVALPLYERTLEVMEGSAKKLECHVVEGTHHVHLNNPEIIGPLINRFFETKEDDVVY